MPTAAAAWASNAAIRMIMRLTTCVAAYASPKASEPRMAANGPGANSSPLSVHRGHAYYSGHGRAGREVDEGRGLSCDEPDGHGEEPHEQQRGDDEEGYWGEE